ncbi:Protein PilN (plasmid) [Pararobbsia alpina]|uniref:protein PilN n=1 Tax=Pararobbsia alpina TaxID=621374 RepID=UPI0039A53BB2
MTFSKFALRPVVAALVVASLLTGCVSPELAMKTKHETDTALQSYGSVSDQFVASVKHDRASIEAEEDVDKPYLAGKAVPLARSVTLPLALQGNVNTVVLFPEPSVTLAVAAERIFKASGIPVKVAPDVYIPMAMLLPLQLGKGESNEKSSGGSGKALAALGPAPSHGSPLPNGMQAGIASTDSPDSVQLRDKEAMPLAQILDLITTRLSINWEYDSDKNVIRLYRLTTKTWKVPVAPSKDSFTTTFQQSTQQLSSSSGSVQQSQTDQPNKSEVKDLDELDELKKSLAPAMTQAGSVDANYATGTITLTDTKEAVERADDIMKDQIGILSRAVQLNFEQVQVTINDDGEAGVDWNVLLSKALSSVPGFSLAATAPLSLVSANAGSLALNLTSGSFKGTSGIIKALSDIGHVKTSTGAPMMVRNRHSGSTNSRKLFSYVSSTTPATATAGGTGGVPGITTSQGSVGFKLVVYPDITKNDIYLTMGFDSSQLNDLAEFNSGSGANQQTVQEPDITGNGIGGTLVPMHNGETVIVTGFDQTSNQYDKRTLGAKLPVWAGGSETANHTRTFTLVLMTASIKDLGAGL